MDHILVLVSNVAESSMYYTTYYKNNTIFHQTKFNVTDIENYWKNLKEEIMKFHKNTKSTKQTTYNVEIETKSCFVDDLLKKTCPEKLCLI